MFNRLLTLLHKFKIHYLWFIHTFRLIRPSFTFYHFAIEDLLFLWLDSDTDGLYFILYLYISIGCICTYYHVDAFVLITMWMYFYLSPCGILFPNTTVIIFYFYIYFLLVYIHGLFRGINPRDLQLFCTNFFRIFTFLHSHALVVCLRCHFETLSRDLRRKCASRLAL